MPSSYNDAYEKARRRNDPPAGFFAMENTLCVAFHDLYSAYASNLDNLSARVWLISILALPLGKKTA